MAYFTQDSPENRGEGRFEAVTLSVPSFSRLGRSVAIAAADRIHGTRLVAESYLLVERDAKRLSSTRSGLETSQLTDETTRAEFNVEFMFREALARANSMFGEKQLAAFEQTKDLNLFATPVSAVSINQRVSSWVLALSPWTKELQQIAEATQVKSLGDWITKVLFVRRLIAE
jgi:hypothetical protein